MKHTHLILSLAASAIMMPARAADTLPSEPDTTVVDLLEVEQITVPEITAQTVNLPQITIPTPEMPDFEMTDLNLPDLSWRKHSWRSPYTLPATMHGVNPNWHRMWINTAVLSGAFVGTLFVLELLPEDATSWNRAYIQHTPMFKRWYRNIFVRDPEWDHDNPIFNYVLHPYAGAAYFMSARSCGFSFWGSMLYSAAISTVGWEFGIEAFMERPSYQDLFITPVVGSMLGELFYRGKHAIVNQGYELLGSYALGRAVCFLLDPVNEVIDLFRGNPNTAYAKARRSRIEASFTPGPNGFAMVVKF